MLHCRYAIGASNPYSHLLQFAVSLCQLYGDTVYFATEILDGLKHSDPNPIYFYGYFIGMNGIWLIVPALILWRSGARILEALRAAESKAKSA